MVSPGNLRLPIDVPPTESELISMKLIFCPKCYDVVRLYDRRRYCKCRASWGHYKDDGLHAVINDVAVPLGFDNRSFAEGIINRPTGKAPSRIFKAFVIGESSNIEVKR